MTATMPASITVHRHRSGASRTRSGRTWIALGYLAAIAACTGFLALIPVGRPIWNSLWAEDGTIFYRDAVTRSWPAVIVRPYSGYLHLVPRLISGIAALVPIGDAPIVFTAGSIVVRALMSVFVFRASASQLPTPAFRLLAAGAVVLVPAGETYDNVANLHWYLIAGAFWAVLWRPVSRAGAAVAAAVVVAAVCSDPLALALGPLVVLRGVSLRSGSLRGVSLQSGSLRSGSLRSGWRWRWRDQVVTIAFGCAAAVQLAAVAMAAQSHRTSYSWEQLPAIAAARVVVPFAVGRHLAASFAGTASEAGLLLATLGILILICWPGLRAGGRARGVVVAALFVDAVVLAGAWRFSAGDLAHPVRDLSGNSRYAVSAMILLGSALSASLSTFQFRAPLIRRFSFACVVTGVVSYGMLFGQPLNTSRPGPIWSTQVVAARDRCIDNGDSTEQLQIRPDWVVTLPCDVLGRPTPRVGDIGPRAGTVSRAP